MNVRLIGETGHQRIFVVVFDTGDDVVEGLLACARDHHLTAASFTAIGAFERVTLGYFEIERRSYKRIQITEQVEVLSLIGNIAVADAGPKVHAHVVLGRSDGSALGGHLLESHVRPTLEVVLTESPAHLRRSTDAETGLPLLDLDRTR